MKLNIMAKKIQIGSSFTDYAEKKVVDKYRKKVLFRYDLAEFRKDGYSKEINLLRSLFDEKYRLRFLQCYLQV